MPADATFKMTGLKNVTATLKDLRKAVKARESIKVGYDTPYAIYVHENLAMNHPNGGQAKYLEAPLNYGQPQMGALIAEELRKKKSVVRGLIKAAFWLLDESLTLVPIDTKRLYNSGYVTDENGKKIDRTIVTGGSWLGLWKALWGSHLAS